VEALRSTCPDAQFILRGLGPKSSGPNLKIDTWPNMYTVVCTRTLASSAFCVDTSLPAVPVATGRVRNTVLMRSLPRCFLRCHYGALQATQHFNYLMKVYAATNPNVHYLVRPCMIFDLKSRQCVATHWPVTAAAARWTSSVEF